MATIPNRYYNSPWIQAAGENLAAALAPRDPQKTLQAQRDKWMFERQQEMARIQDEDRVKEDAGTQALGDLLANAGTAPAQPHSPGEASYFAQNPAAANTGMDDAAFQGSVRTALAGNRSLSDVVTAAGPRGSAYLGKLGLLDDKERAALVLQGARGDDAYSRAQLGQDGAWARAVMADNRARDLATDNDKLRRDLAAMQDERNKAHDERVTARGTGGTPLDVSPTDAVNVGYNLEDWAAGMGLDKLPPDVFNALKTRTNDLYQVSRNASTAQAQALREFFGPNPKVDPANDSFWFDPFHSDKPATLPLRDNMGLGDIVRGLPPSRPTAAPVAAAPTAAAPAPPSLIAAPQKRVLVRTPDDARRLPPGTPFITPDGRTGTT